MVNSRTVLTGFFGRSASRFAPAPFLFLFPLRFGRGPVARVGRRNVGFFGVGRGPLVSGVGCGPRLWQGVGRRTVGVTSVGCWTAGVFGVGRGLFFTLCGSRVGGRWPSPPFLQVQAQGGRVCLLLLAWCGINTKLGTVDWSKHVLYEYRRWSLHLLPLHRWSFSDAAFRLRFWCYSWIRASNFKKSTCLDRNSLTQISVTKNKVIKTIKKH